MRLETDDKSALYKAEEPEAITFTQIATGHLCVYVFHDKGNGTSKGLGGGAQRLREYFAFGSK